MLLDLLKETKRVWRFAEAHWPLGDRLTVEKEA